MKNLLADITMTATECARRTGLTVKALRVYEREGLLYPKRTQKDWRIYDASDLARLGEVTALRALGLKLADIAKLLKGNGGDIGRMLELQQEDLLARRNQTELALSIVSELRVRTARGETLTINDLSTAIKESHMNSSSAETISWKRYEQMRPRVAIKADVKNMHDCAGHFQLGDTNIFDVFEQNGDLMAQLTGQQALQIFPEAADRYFYTAVPAQLSFERGDDGKIVALVLHQNGIEQRAPRISAQQADQAVADLAARMKSGLPAAGAAEILEACVKGQMVGEPPYEMLHDALAVIVREQTEMATKDLAELGQLKSISFLAVTPEGWDVFRVKFEKGELDWSLHMGADGKADGQWIEAPRTEQHWKRIQERGLN